MYFNYHFRNFQLICELLTPKLNSCLSVKDKYKIYKKTLIHLNNDTILNWFWIYKLYWDTSKDCHTIHKIGSAFESKTLMKSPHQKICHESKMKLLTHLTLQKSQLVFQVNSLIIICSVYFRYHQKQTNNIYINNSTNRISPNSNRKYRTQTP